MSPKCILKSKAHKGGTATPAEDQSKIRDFGQSSGTAKPVWEQNISIDYRLAAIQNRMHVMELKVLAIALLALKRSKERVKMGTTCISDKTVSHSSETTCVTTKDKNQVLKHWNVKMGQRSQSKTILSSVLNQAILTLSVGTVTVSITRGSFLCDDRKLLLEDPNNESSAYIHLMLDTGTGARTSVYQTNTVIDYTHDNKNKRTNGTDNLYKKTTPVCQNTQVSCKANNNDIGNTWHWWYAWITDDRESSHVSRASQKIHVSLQSLACSIAGKLPICTVFNHATELS